MIARTAERAKSTRTVSNRASVLRDILVIHVKVSHRLTFGERNCWKLFVGRQTEALDSLVMSEVVGFGTSRCQRVFETTDLWRLRDVLARHRCRREEAWSEKGDFDAERFAQGSSCKQRGVTR